MFWPSRQLQVSREKGRGGHKVSVIEVFLLLREVRPSPEEVFPNALDSPPFSYSFLFA